MRKKGKHEDEKDAHNEKRRKKCPSHLCIVALGILVRSYTVHMPPGHEYPITPAPQATPETAAPEPTPGWVHRHPYLASTVVAVSLLVILILVVAARSGVGGSDMGNNWVGAGSVFFTGGRNLTQAERMTAQEVVKQQSPDTQLGYIPIAMQSADGVQEDGTYGNDLSSLLALLTQPKGSASAGASAQTESGFSLIPQGLISVADPTVKRTPEAEALFSYGNEVGTYVQGFESMHSNSAQILKDQAEDRTNAEKAARVDALGYAMAELGRDLNQMQEIPASARAAHTAYATSYRLAGTNLTKVAAAKTDEEYIDAIGAYNTSVESLSKRFLVLVGLFSANNVSFSSSDPGSMFVFNPTFSF